MEQEEARCGATTTQEEVEPADDFSDVEDLEREGISLPPTREELQKLLKVYEEKYKDELYTFHLNYNAKKREDGRATNINYSEIQRVLSKEFNFYKLKSTPGQPFSNTRGEYLARITGEEKLTRVNRLRHQIRERLKSDPKMNVEAVHIKASPAVNYGDAEEMTETSCSTVRTTPVHQRRARSLPRGQTLMDSYLHGNESTLPPPSADQGYGTQGTFPPSPPTSETNNDWTGLPSATNDCDYLAETYAHIMNTAVLYYGLVLVNSSLLQ